MLLGMCRTGLAIHFPSAEEIQGLADRLIPEKLASIRNHEVCVPVQLMPPVV